MIGVATFASLFVNMERQHLLQVVHILIIWALVPVIPWPGEIEHLASRAAPLTRTFVQRFGMRIPAAETG